MKQFLLLVLLTATAMQAQIRGTVSDKDGNPLPFVSVFLENSFRGTTTNDAGKYELDIYSDGKYRIVFQYLGYRTKVVEASPTEFPFTLDVTLTEENIVLQEIVINPKDNPANGIIRNAIAARKTNSEKLAKFKADFYSRGIFRIKDAPKRVLGTKLDMFDEYLDSTRSGILYLSETVSKIVYQKPDKLKETIVASKVSGDDNGYSFNNAASVDFDFYENYVPFSVNVVSPIASNAFDYYRFKLEGSFFDEANRQINKIRVTPRRKTDPAVEGYLYIVDDSWAIYATDFSVRGDNIQMPMVNLLVLKQGYAYNQTHDIWVKNTQVLDFEAAMLGVKISGKFTYVYSNFEFPDAFPKRTFTAEVLSFEENANKKSNDFWNEIRPVPLTEEEERDYEKKDKLQERKKSKQYLDSVDAVKNKFRWFGAIGGYTYHNSFQNYSITYDGLITSLGFNTVQGYHVSTGLSFTKRNPDKHTFYTIGSSVNYGFSEDRFRATGFVRRKFNNTNRLEMTLSGGSTVQQFNPQNPISRIVNSLATTLFRNNFMKLYDKTFAALQYRQEWFNGFHVSGSLEYSRRKPLFNNTDESILHNDKGYTSNNPLEPMNYTSVPFETHELAKGSVIAQINFGQQYWTRPDGKFTIRNENFPTLFLGYEKGFAGSDEKYNYDHVMARLFYDLGLGTRGNLGLNTRVGKFFNADSISFTDYRHFNGNLTHIGQADRYLNVFNLMPYYDFSTNDQYFELHAEYTDNGYIINRIPLLNKLKANLVLGYHNLAQPAIRPYSEYSIGLDNLGIGKVRFLRIDYVRSYQSDAFIDHGVIFGLKFLNLIE